MESGKIKKKNLRNRMEEESNHLNKPVYRSKYEDFFLKKRLQNHTMWGRKVRKYRFFFILMMYLSLYDYQAKASRYRKGLTYLKNRATTNQNQTLHSQKQKSTQA